MTVYELFAGLAAEATRQELAWMDSAACASVGDDFWFVEKGGNSRPAKRVCEACPVRTECLEYALEHDERFGIWGGMSEKQRRALKRSRDGQVAA